MNNYVPGVGVQPPYNPNAPQVPAESGRVVHHHHYHTAPAGRLICVRVEQNSQVSRFTCNLAIVALVVLVVGVIFDSAPLLVVGGVCVVWSLVRCAREDPHGRRLIMHGIKDIVVSIVHTLFVQWVYKRFICQAIPIRVCVR